jgi:4-amino-4-deoxy-L-arabinose transferase-like glycosyltransferase
MTSTHSFSPLWLVFAAVLLCWNLNYAPLWNPDEGRYAAAALEMAQPFSGEKADWIVPHLNTVPRLNKPPLVYWLSALFIDVFGRSAGAARMPSVIAALGVLLIVWQLGRKMFNDRTGVLAALVWATMTLPFILSHTLNTDMLLTFTVALSLLGLWMMGDEKTRDVRHTAFGALIAGIGLGLAMLAKGPVGVILPIGIWGLTRILTQGRRVFCNFPWLAGVGALLLASLISAPWYVAIAQVHPEFLKSFLFGENIARLTGSQFYHKPQPLYFYLPVLLLGLLPWTAFLIPATTNLFRDWRKGLRDDSPAVPPRDRHSRLFLWLWGLIVIGLFSISHVKLITYILPAFPAFAILIAEAITSTQADDTMVTERPLELAKWATAALLLILAIALPLAFFRPHGLSEKAVPISEIGAAVVALSIICILTALLVTFRPRQIQVIVPVGAAAMFIALLAGAGRAARYEDSSSMVMALQPYLKSNDVFVQFKTFDPTAVFYANRPLAMIEVENRSGWDEDEFRDSPRFPADRHAMKKILQDAAKHRQRVFVLAKWKFAHFPMLAGLHVIAISNDYRLLSNQPAPQGFSYEFIAPLKRQRELSPACKALDVAC